MKNNIAILLLLTVVMTACGTFKKAANLPDTTTTTQTTPQDITTPCDAIIATLGLIFPSLIITIIIAGFLQRFRQSPVVDALFYGLRAASVALITAALLQVARIALFDHTAADGSVQMIYWPAIILCAAVFVCIRYTPLKKFHPILFIAVSAFAGIVLGM